MIQVPVAFCVQTASFQRVCAWNAEALFFGGSFSGKAPKQHFNSTHDQAWHTAKIALISTVLWVPVGLGMIFVSPLPLFTSPLRYVSNTGTRLPLLTSQLYIVRVSLQCVYLQQPRTNEATLLDMLWLLPKHVLIVAQVSWSAKHFSERNWHSAIPSVVAGVCFL